MNNYQKVYFLVDIINPLYLTTKKYIIGIIVVLKEDIYILGVFLWKIEYMATRELVQKDKI